jgi:hypothetical protein
VFLGIGLLLYVTRQWGDGDAWLLGAFGFLFPTSLQLPGVSPASPAAGLVFPFPVTALLNFFILGFAYLVAYSLALGLMNRREGRKFLREFRQEKKNLAAVAALLLLAAASLLARPVLAGELRGLPPSLPYFPALLAFIVVFMQYGRFVEKSLFKKRIPVKRLRAGDVLARERWRGLTEQEVRELKKKGGSVWVKEGVRFAPVFLITLLVTLFYGSLIVLFV